MAGVSAIVGRQGDGKSYSAVELALIPALNAGRHIVTNLPLIYEAIEKDYPDYQITEIDLKKEDCLDNPVYGAVYILDELWKIWKNGDKMRDIKESHLSFLKEHRHMSDEQGISIDVFLLTQTLNDLPKAIRDTIEKTIICQKLLSLGMDGHFRRDYYSGAQTGFTGKSNDFLFTDPQLKYSPEVYKYYKTHMFNNSGGQVNEQRLKKATIFSGFGFKFKLFVFFIILSLCGWSFYSLFSKDEVFAVNPKIQSKKIHKPQQINSDFNKPQNNSNNKNIVKQVKKPFSKSVTVNYLYELLENFEVSLNGVIKGKDSKGIYKFNAVVDFLQNGQLKESFTATEIKKMGWSVSLQDYGLLLSYGSTQYIVRRKPHNFSTGQAMQVGLK